MRKELKDLSVDVAVAKVKRMIANRLIQKGTKAFASKHEAYGIIAEEMYELTKALHENDNDNFHEELIDIAVGCIIAYASEI